MKMADEALANVTAEKPGPQPKHLLNINKPHLDHYDHLMTDQNISFDNIDWSKLSDEEKWRLKHAKFHQEHQGHQAMHAEMVLILLIALVVSQMILIVWKKKHFKSYQYASLLGMWIVPVGISVMNHWWRFIFLWLVFSCITGLIMRKALQKPLCVTTPRLVYKWFLFLYTLSYILGIIGYIFMLGTLFGINLLFNILPQVWMDLGLLFLYYGLYYGVLGRDLADISADKMAAHIGYYSPEGMPTRMLDPHMCSLCANRLIVGVGEDALLEKTYRLSCGHEFHEFCIRGWCIVGKKQICPYCKEKVDLKRMLQNPWEKPHLFYGQLLDWIRWLVAWQPLIILISHGINWTLGLS